ncbi:MAG: nucleotide sugar dehydrogenase [Chitinophagaceae bacterium]|nr:nucleotide sugar dehydrogenase [Chitinophagaceae bacterium]
MQHTIAIIGLGYVGLPLFAEFGKKYQTWGFDINSQRIQELKNGIDKTGAVDKTVLNPKSNYITKNIDDIKHCNTFIITVPTPLTSFKAPDLTPLLDASRMIGKILKKKDIIIYESTVYPGCTEEDCVPVLEKESDLQFNKDFFCGYSPERINPGDTINTLTNIKKITSGSTPEIAEIVDALYNSIITAGTHKAPSLKVAEAGKAIENAQRDLNISFMNELSLIFDRMGIDTNDVIEAAGTKWNFLKFKPGLVGGHCIGVDPYYLAHKAESLGYYPQVILSGRRVNDYMATFIAHKIIKLFTQKDKHIKNSHILILGITFKENCHDIRNTKIIDIYNQLINWGIHCDVYDPWAHQEEVMKEYKIKLIPHIDNTKKYDGILLAVAHNNFETIDFKKYKEEGSVIFDAKAFIERSLVDARL